MRTGRRLSMRSGGSPVLGGTVTASRRQLDRVPSDHLPGRAFDRSGPQPARSLSTTMSVWVAARRSTCACCRQLPDKITRRRWNDSPPRPATLAGRFHSCLSARLLRPELSLVPFPQLAIERIVTHAAMSVSVERPCAQNRTIGARMRALRHRCDAARNRRYRTPRRSR